MQYQLRLLVKRRLSSKYTLMGLQFFYLASRISQNLKILRYNCLSLESTCPILYLTLRIACPLSLCSFIFLFISFLLFTGTNTLLLEEFTPLAKEFPLATVHVPGWAPLVASSRAPGIVEWGGENVKKRQKAGIR